MELYTSSIVEKYGDTLKVKADCNILLDIFNRQGMALLLDFVAEKVGQQANYFDLNEQERLNLKRSTLLTFTQELEERL